MTPTACSDVKQNAAPGVRLIGSPDETWNFDQQCATLGLSPHRAASADESEPDETPLLQAGPATIETISHSLSLPFSGFLETCPNGLAGITQRCIKTARAGGLVLSLTSATACTLPVVELISIAIRRRLALPDGEVAELMEICLGEAVSNAVIHGNLEIPNHLRATPKGFESFRQIMRERLCDQTMASRRIEVHALRDGELSFTLFVSDQGGGFNLESKLEKETRVDAHSGRGLGLIRRACARIGSEDGGRTLVMTFPRLCIAQGN
ncbi:ATP-binding protein [Magnetospirillum molischianum]|nr:ATP-binding protein [Magnetospirillum molischianum]